MAKEEKTIKEPTNERELRIKQLEDRRLAAKAARIGNVTARIETARLEREKGERETGIVETSTVRAAREAEEKELIEEATKDRKIEYVASGSGNALTDGLIDALNQVIAHINGDEVVPAFTSFKVTDSLYYNETGRTSPGPEGEAAVKGQ